MFGDEIKMIRPLLDLMLDEDENSRISALDLALYLNT